MSPSVYSFVVSMANPPLPPPAPTGGGSRSVKVQRRANSANSGTQTQPFLSCSVEAQPGSVQPLTPPNRNLFYWASQVLGEDDIVLKEPPCCSTMLTNKARRRK